MSTSKKVHKVTLPKPHVLEVKNGVLHFPSLNGGPATAEVAYDAIKAGDTIVLSMDRLVVIYEITHVVSASDASSGKVTIHIDNEYLARDVVDYANVFYSVNQSPRSGVLDFALSY